MKIYKIIILTVMIICLFYLSGCGLNHYSYDFNSSSNSECLSICEDYMIGHICLEMFPYYETNFLNGNKTKGICSCYVTGCFE